ncbi:hypothetical protein L1987_57561 [Smallanthus sonchifolius]|uniref:Uncharacterized protein n=1 Tax=Smallanthus sonchifolius TaxID=185202 RepID=A0ACB9DCY7_9ASTR|nr:hypothetical protein L1987_57561 [Smallanthus sonchifolius]
MSWKYVSWADKNALNEHLKQNFDMDAIRRHALQTKLRGGLDANKTRLEAFHDAHTFKDGTFDNELAVQQYTNPSSLTQAQIAGLFQEPNFRDELLKFMASNKTPNMAQDGGDKDDMDEGDGNDDTQ